MINHCTVLKFLDIGWSKQCRPRSDATECSVASIKGIQCLPLQQFLGLLTGKIDLFNYFDKYGKKRYPDT